MKITFTPNELKQMLKSMLPKEMIPAGYSVHDVTSEGYPERSFTVDLQPEPEIKEKE